MSEILSKISLKIIKIIKIFKTDDSFLIEFSV